MDDFDTIWNTDNPEIDVLAEVEETLYKMVRNGEIEPIPGTTPQKYRFVTLGQDRQ